MKKKIFVILCLLIFPMLVLFAGCSTDSKIEIRINDGYVQWSYAHQDEWTNIISIEDIKNNLGEAYKGNAGKDGREIELRDFNGVIQWKYVDESEWKNLSKKNTFTVNFDSQGGTNIETISNIIENTKIKKPTDPTRDGYIFDGWYYQNEKWSFVGFPVTENMALTAHWNPIFVVRDETIYSLTPYASNIKELIIPSQIDGINIEKIADNAFCDNKLLEKVTIPNSIKSIGKKAFSGCSFLSSIEGANNVEDVGYDIFSDTAWLKKAKQSNDLISLGSICLGCGENFSSKELIISDKFKVLVGDGFRNSRFSSITLGKNLKEISYFSWANADVIFNGTVEDWCNIKFEILENYYVSEGLFVNVNGFYINNKLVTNLTIPNTVKKIPNYAFSGYEKLKSVEIPTSVKEIGFWAFKDCIGLTSVIIPNSVEEIGEVAFAGGELYCESTSQPSGWKVNWYTFSSKTYWYSETKPTTSGNYWHYENDEIKIWGKIDLDLGLIYVNTNCQYNVNENITGFLPADIINIDYKIKDNDFIGKYLRFKIIATPDIVENISINENFVKYDDFYYYINRGYFEGLTDRPILQDTCNIDIDLRIYCLIKNNIGNDVKSFNFSIIVETIQSANLSDPLNYWRTIPQQYNEKIPDTTIDPSIIYNEVNFIDFVAKVNNGTASDYYVIARDLSFTGELPAITGAFDGILDGNGHTLYNVNISNHNGSELYGIFAKTTKNALIQNLKIENLTIDAKNISTGLLVGANYGTIKNCEIKGITINNSTGSDFIGKNCGSKINCILK